MINILVLRERVLMLFSFSLTLINAPVNRMLISTLSFLYSFTDQDRMNIQQHTTYANV